MSRLSLFRGLYMRNLSRFFLLPLLFLCGCVATEFFSHVNPDWERVKYQRVLIQFLDLRPGYAQYGEQTLQQAVSMTFGADIHCYLFTDEFYVGLIPRPSMKADIQAFERDKNIDALLICFSGGNQGLKENQYPNPLGYGTNSVMTEQKNANCRLELIDLRARQSVWYSQGHMDAN